MQELNMMEVDLVSGGVMSTKTKIIIGCGFLVGGVLLGGAMLIGYYCND